MAAVVDLRSDTVTQPTMAMRRAMAEAIVGDDGYGEDPTVRELEERFARRVGKEAAVLVPSGVMANQIALRVLTRPGDLVVAGRRQHVILYEMGAAGLNAGIQFSPIDDVFGVLDPSDVAQAIANVDHHHPRVGALFVESPHMASGGYVSAPDQLRALAEVASGLPIHLDGARLFNAEIATGISAADLASPVTTVMACLSKGLACPIGSLLAGPSDVIERARVERKRLGGSMRQAGIVAAPGLVALGEMIPRLADDHRRARLLADAVATRWPSTKDEVDLQPTNLVVFTHFDTDALVSHLRSRGVLAGTIAPATMRFVTHCDVDDEGIERAVDAIGDAP